MPARLTAYPPDGAALVRVLDDGGNYRIGRSSACEVRIEHSSVSRFHAELDAGASAWRLSDTGSKNGLRVDGQLVRGAELAARTWFTVGDVQCVFEPLDADAAATQRAAMMSRRAQSRALSAGLQRPDIGMRTLVPQMLDMVLEFSGLERGFVLHADPGERPRVRASRAIRAVDFAGDRFAGSAAVVDRVLAERRSMVCCDTGDAPWLAQRPSVRLGGIRAILCVPLSMQDGSSGVIYADSRTPGPAVTELDVELVENVAAQASTAIEAARLRERIENLVDALDEHAAMPYWDEVRGSGT